jgi:hypothetical protein
VALHSACCDSGHQLFVLVVLLQIVHLHLLLLQWCSWPVTGQHGTKPRVKPNTCCRTTVAALDDATTLFDCVSMWICCVVERMLWLQGTKGQGTCCCLWQYY